MQVTAVLVSDVWSIAFSVFTVFANGLIVYAAGKADSILRTYAVLMRLISLTAIYMAFNTIMATGGTVTVATYHFFLNRSLVGLAPAIVQDIFTCSKMWTFYMYNFMNPLAFVFRYSIVVRQTPFTTHQLLGIYLIFGVVSAATTLGSFILEMSSPLKRPEFIDVLKKTLSINGKTPYFHVYNPEATVFSTIGAAILVLNFLVSLFCGYEILRHVRAQARLMSSDSRLLNSRLDIIFFLQIFYPLALTVVPVGLNTFLSTAGIDFPEMEQIQNALTIMVPGLDAATVLLLIPHYREVFRFRQQNNRVTSVSTSMTKTNIKA